MNVAKAQQNEFMKACPDNAVVTALIVAIYKQLESLPKEDREAIIELGEIGLSYLRKNDREGLARTHEVMTEILFDNGISFDDFSLEPRDTTKLSRWLRFVGPAIRRERKNRNLTQKELAEITGLPQSHISKLEREQHSPSRITLEKIAAGLGIPVSQLDPGASDEG